MAIELAQRRMLPKPWGVADLRPWSEPTTAGNNIGEICYERSCRLAAAPALLLKVLLTRLPLSIQVHPDDSIAHAMGLPNGKTEAWYILGAEPGAAVAVGLNEALTPLQLRAAIEDGSIAALVAWRAVAAGDVVFVPAGTIHAIGAGLVIAEIQQRSDTTFRLFDHGRTRELHVEPALAAVRAAPAAAQAPPIQLSEERTLFASNAHFVFERIELAPDSTWVLKAGRETWLLVLDGAASMADFDVVKGSAVFAEEDRVALVAGTDGVIFLAAYPGAGGHIQEFLERTLRANVQAGPKLQKSPRLQFLDSRTASSTRTGSIQ